MFLLTKKFNFSLYNVRNFLVNIFISLRSTTSNNKTQISSITGSPIDIADPLSETEGHLMEQNEGEFHQTTAAVTANFSFEAFCGSLTQKYN